MIDDAPAWANAAMLIVLTLLAPGGAIVVSIRAARATRSDVQAQSDDRATTAAAIGRIDQGIADLRADIRLVATRLDHHIDEHRRTAA